MTSWNENGMFPVLWFGLSISNVVGLAESSKSIIDQWDYITTNQTVVKLKEFKGSNWKKMKIPGPDRPRNPTLLCVFSILYRKVA